MDEPQPEHQHPVDGWILSGGQGLRMGGQDKGLLPWRGQPLAWHAAQALAPQVRQLRINANRHLDDYGRWPWPVVPDDADLPGQAGPLNGILTGLRHSQGPWLQVWPCDSPEPPSDLVVRLMAQAQQHQADIAVPISPAHGREPERHHWTCALIHHSQAARLEGLIHLGERRVRAWITQGRWIGVSFDRADAFININAPETLHAHR